MVDEQSHHPALGWWKPRYEALLARIERGPFAKGTCDHAPLPPRRGACPECHGTRTMDGITDEASAAAWLDCTTCSAIPKSRGSGLTRVPSKSMHNGSQEVSRG